LHAPRRGQWKCHTVNFSRFFPNSLLFSRSVFSSFIPAGKFLLAGLVTHALIKERISESRVRSTRDEKETLGAAAAAAARARAASEAHRGKSGDLSPMQNTGKGHQAGENKASLGGPHSLPHSNVSPIGCLLSPSPPLPIHPSFPNVVACAFIGGEEEGETVFFASFGLFRFLSLHHHRLIGRLHPWHLAKFARGGLAYRAFRENLANKASQ